MARLERSFEYQALEDTNSIRVVKLFSALHNDRAITIELSDIRLSSDIEYEALSYTWDDQKPTRHITCNEKSLGVTENVYQALKQLRNRKPQRRVLWIDAICINQNDPEEKTAQVSIMGDIYTRAQRVNVWLSRSTEGMRAIFEYVRLSNSPKITFDDVSNEQVAILMDGLKQLSAHPYWTRVWTVQEFTLNQNCWVYLSQLKPLKALNFGVMLHDVEGYMNLRAEEIAQPDLEYLYPIDRGTLRHLLGKKAKIPSDIVFAYRALFPELLGQIKVDYERDLSDLLLEATVRIVPGLKKLGDLLEVVSHCPRVPKAPSWTLNFTGSGRLWNRAHSFGSFYPTRGYNVPDTTVTHRISSDMKTLYVRGLIVDRVAVVSDEFPHYSLRKQAAWHDHVRDMLIQWRIRTSDNLDPNFEESMIDILFAATNAIEELAGKILQTNRFERVHVYDEDGETLLSKSKYTM